jgi:DNA-binding winged helix-turn-helix (wHTH) protein
MSAQTPAGTWQIGEWIVDPKDDTLTSDRESVKIEPRMMSLLIYLAESNGAVVSQEQLLTDTEARPCSFRRQTIH